MDIEQKVRWDEFINKNNIPVKFKNVENKLLTNFLNEIFISWLNTENKKNIMLYGFPGRGKTYTAYCLVKMLLRKNYTNQIEFVTHFYINEKIKFNNKNGIIYCQEIEKLKTVDYLFIDDITTIHTDTELQGFYQIIDYRWSNNKPIIFTSCYSWKELQNIFRMKIISRLKNVLYIYFDGEDLRNPLD